MLWRALKKKNELKRLKNHHCLSLIDFSKQRNKEGNLRPFGINPRWAAGGKWHITENSIYSLFLKKVKKDLQFLIKDTENWLK